MIEYTFGTERHQTSAKVLFRVSRVGELRCQLYHGRRVTITLMLSWVMHTTRVRNNIMEGLAAVSNIKL
jgi:hypothetical protein